VLLLWNVKKKSYLSSPLVGWDVMILLDSLHLLKKVESLILSNLKLKGKNLTYLELVKFSLVFPKWHVLKMRELLTLKGVSIDYLNSSGINVSKSRFNSEYFSKIH
jgi:hypothetical protein